MRYVEWLCVLGISCKSCTHEDRISMFNSSYTSTRELIQRNYIHPQGPLETRENTGRSIDS